MVIHHFSNPFLLLGTALPDDLVLLHEHSDHYSLQCDVPMTLESLFGLFWTLSRPMLTMCSPQQQTRVVFVTIPLDPERPVVQDAPSCFLIPDCPVVASLPSLKSVTFPLPLQRANRNRASPCPSPSLFWGCVPPRKRARRESLCLYQDRPEPKTYFYAPSTAHELSPLIEMPLCVYYVHRVLIPSTDRPCPMTSIHQPDTEIMLVSKEKS